MGEELTPSLKVKRKVAIQKYQHLLDELYDGKAAKPGDGEAARAAAGGAS